MKMRSGKFMRLNELIYNQHAPGQSFLKTLSRSQRLKNLVSCLPRQPFWTTYARWSGLKQSHHESDSCCTVKCYKSLCYHSPLPSVRTHGKSSSPYISYTLSFLHFTLIYINTSTVVSSVSASSGNTNFIKMYDYTNKEFKKKYE